MESSSYENWDEIEMFFGHLVIGNLQLVIGNRPLAIVIGFWSLALSHWNLVIGTWSFVIGTLVLHNWQFVIIKGWVKKKGLTSTHNYVKPKEFCDFNNHILWYSPVFEVFKMGCNISVGQGIEFIRPDIVMCRSQPLFFDSPFNY